MILRFLGFRLAAVAFTLGAVLSPPAAHAQTAESRAGHISVIVKGKGAPVILLPGLSSPRAVWDGVAPDLARTHRVYLVQVNGFGGDDPGANLEPGILDGVVADVHALIVREKLARPAVVGHSMGGLVGLMLAKTHPADVGRLMVVDALPFVGVIFTPDATVATLEPQARLMRQGMQAGYGRPADPAIAQGIASRLALTPAAQAKVAQWSAAADGRVAGEAMYEDMTTDLRPDMAALTVPITAIYPADGDALYRAAYGRTNTRYVPVADTRHFIMLDQPAAFRAALDAFLAAPSTLPPAGKRD